MGDGDKDVLQIRRLGAGFRLDAFLGQDTAHHAGRIVFLLAQEDMNPAAQLGDVLDPILTLQRGTGGMEVLRLDLDDEAVEYSGLDSG